MNKFILTLVYVLFSFNSYSQLKNKSYEQVAIDFFADKIIKSDFKNVKYFIFNGKVVDESSSKHSSCLRLKKVVFKSPNINEVKIPKNNKIYHNLGFFTKVFTSKRRIRTIEVYKHYPKDKDTYIVVIYLNGSIRDSFYSISIDKDSKKVNTFCVENFDS